MGRNVLNTPNSPVATAGPPRSRVGGIVAPVSPVALGVDLVAVLLFVVVGRLSHDESLTPGGVLETAWPFLIGLAGGVVGLLLTRWPAFSLQGGAMMAFKTVVLGLVIRYAIQDADTPLAFCLVTAVVITGLMLGWRLVAAERARR